MRVNILTILFTLSLYSCDDSVSNQTKDADLGHKATNQLESDSIDKYSIDCTPPRNAKIYQSIPRIIDSIWNVLLAIGTSDKHYSFSKLSEALLRQHFSIDSSGGIFVATKRAFNERVKITRENGSNNVELHFTFWNEGKTLMIMGSRSGFN